MGQLAQQGSAVMSGASGGEPIFIGTPSQVQQHLGQSRDAVLKSGANNPVMNPKPQTGAKKNAKAENKQDSGQAVQSNRLGEDNPPPVAQQPPVPAQESEPQATA